MNLDADAFDALFDSFRVSVTRLEQLPVYAVGGAEFERIAAWRSGRSRPERSVTTSPWLARMASGAIAGKTWSRVRIVDDPLTEYQRYQLESYRESQVAGERIVLVPRSAAPRSGPDFWLVDGAEPDGCAVLMHYAEDGRLLGREMVTDRAAVVALARAVTEVSSLGMPLNEFLASVTVGG